MEFKTTKDFDRETRRLYRKYPSIIADIRQLKNDLIENPYLGTPLGNNCYKIRMAIRSKGKGKSGGGRVITCVKIMDEVIHLLTIYDKSDIENISDEYLDDLRNSVE